MKVKNLNGAGKSQCNCGNWFNHWKNHSGQVPFYCSAVNCFYPAEAGAQVQMDAADDANWYIVPLCDYHNRTQVATLEIRRLVNLVSANISETCGI